jgi:hypothetical protein
MARNRPQNACDDFKIRFPRLRDVRANSGCTGDKLLDAQRAHGTVTIQIAKCADAAKALVPMPRRRVVARLPKCRPGTTFWYGSDAAPLSEELAEIRRKLDRRRTCPKHPNAFLLHRKILKL